MVYTLESPTARILADLKKNLPDSVYAKMLLDNTRPIKGKVGLPPLPDCTKLYVPDAMMLTNNEQKKFAMLAKRHGFSSRALLKRLETMPMGAL